MLFSKTGPTEYNACVGENGAPGTSVYASGFAEATLSLINTVLDDPYNKLNVDNSIYPICFNLRHSIELRIKYEIQRISAYLLKNDDYKESISGHEVNTIWTILKKLMRETDERYIDFINNVDRYIIAIGTIDSHGQTFRYPFNVDSTKHLIDQSIINLRVLADDFEYLNDQFKALHYTTDSLISEYETGTFFKFLSRKQLHEIAESLPDYSSWSEASFNSVKNKIRQRYNISNRQLSKAINLIKEHPEFSRLIGLDAKPLFTEDQNLINLIQLISKRENDRDTKSKLSISDGKIFTNTSLDELLDFHSETDQYSEEISKFLSIDCLFEILALKELGSTEDYSEWYEVVLESVKAECSNLCEPSELKDYLARRVSEMNPRNLLIGLNIMGKGKLLEI